MNFHRKNYNVATMASGLKFPLKFSITSRRLSYILIEWNNGSCQQRIVQECKICFWGVFVLSFKIQFITKTSYSILNLFSDCVGAVCICTNAQHLPAVSLNTSMDGNMLKIFWKINVSTTYDWNSENVSLTDIFIR